MTAWLKALRRMIRLPVEERRAAIRAVSGMFAADFGIGHLSLPTLTRLAGVAVGRTRGATSHDSPRGVIPSAIAAEVRAMDRVIRRWPRPTTCLTRAIALGHVLRAHRPTLRIGAERADGAFQAHAWLEVDGVVLSTGVAGETVVFRSLGHAAPEIPL